MLKTKALIRFTFLGATIAWLVLVFSDVTILFSDIKGLKPDIPLWLPRVMLDLYVICLYYYYKLKIEQDEGLNFTDLLWKVFATGLVATVISLAIRFVLYLLGNTKFATNALFGDIIYQINLALLISFLVAAFTSWKRLILYQKSKWLIRIWLAFEFGLLLVLVYDSINIVLSEAVTATLNVLLGVIAIVLSANMKWVAYLNFKQKWTSLLLLLLIFFYLAYFFYTVTRQSAVISEQSAAFVAFTGHIFNLSLFAFVLTYSIFSFLVITFNLPTSSVFEQKLEEVVNFQEFGLLLVLVYDSINIVLSEAVTATLNVLLGVIAIVLSANMKWVAYLNFKQKWTSLLLLLLIFFYLAYFFYTVTRQSAVISEQSAAFVAFTGHIFNLSLFAFVLTYSIFSFLVITFNLPTSSVFEQKLEEVVNFQRISQSIQTEQNEESVYNILLESSVSSVFADAAWLEIQGAGNLPRLFMYRIDEQEAKAIRDHLKSNNIKGILDQGSDKTKNLSKHMSTLRGSRYRSVLAFPISVKGETIGTLALLKELPDGFNKEMTRIVSAFANQAGISIENFRLMEEAFQNERYKEELKIAKNVQKSLLPEKLEQDSDYEIAAFSESADEVGGDYYDTIRVNDHQVAMIIADVSGKGTTAAFHMSQMKGIFHSLAQQELDPKEFMVRANQALVFCLERGSFISATYFVVNARAKKILYARAGHCPVLYFFGQSGTASYLKDKGKALGMIKSRDYCNHVETNEVGYAKGDIMVLYTDGITEAKDAKGDEFGSDRLLETLLEVKEKSSREIQEHLINRLYEFSGSKEINDDYTTMIVKFT